MTEPISQTEERTARIYCPDCGWMKDIEASGPMSEQNEHISAAVYLAVNDIRVHVGQREYSDGETHTPLVFTSDGVRRFEPGENKLYR